MFVCSVFGDFPFDFEISCKDNFSLDIKYHSILICVLIIEYSFSISFIGVFSCFPQYSSMNIFWLLVILSSIHIISLSSYSRYSTSEILLDWYCLIAMSTPPMFTLPFLLIHVLYRLVIGGRFLVSVIVMMWASHITAAISRLIIIFPILFALAYNILIFVMSFFFFFQILVIFNFNLLFFLCL